MTRILTESQRAEHVARYRARYPNLPEAHCERVGDLATINSNQFHNPETGFHEFYPDTLDWVREVEAKLPTIQEICGA